MPYSELEDKIMRSEDLRIKPEFELVSHQDDESIRYLEHGAPSPLIRWHYHKEYELHLVKQTSGKMFVGDYIGNFGPGNLVLVGPDLPHNWISHLDDGETVEVRDLVIQFSQTFIINCQQVIPELYAIKPLLEKSRFGLEFLNNNTVDETEKLLLQLATAQGMRRMVLFFQLMEILTSTEETRTLSSNHHKPLIDEKNLVWVNHAVNFIFENFDRNITLEEAAHHMGMEETHFSKYFKKASGHRFIDFVNRLRIHKACELLAHSETPITDICFSVGFNNISNFNRRFFKIKGMSPREYRKSSRSGFYTGDGSGVSD